MLHTGRGFGKQLIIMGLMIVLELVRFFTTGVDQSHFVAAVWDSGVTAGFMTLGCLVLMLLLSGIRLKKKTHSRTDYLTQRLSISERAFMLWEIIGNGLRFMMLWASQALIIVLLHVLYARFGSGDMSPLREFIGFKASPILMFFFPGNNWIGWLIVLLCAVSFGCASLAVGSDKSAGFKIVGTAIIWFNMLQLLSKMGYGYSFPVTNVTLLAAMDLIAVFFIIIVRSHSGRKAVEDEYIVVQKIGDAS